MQMKTNVVLSPMLHDDLYFTGKTVVVIDVLRATTTIVTAFKNGCETVLPVGSLDVGVRSASDMFGARLLRGGEKNMKKIDGFDLGNSPLEYTQETVAKKAIVFLTTNGSRAAVKTRFSDETIIASFLNANAVVDYLLKKNDNIEILCSGSNGNFCFEDTFLAGYIVKLIRDQKPDLELTDSAYASYLLARQHENDIEKGLAASDHGKNLIKAGFSEDIRFAAQTNITDVIPIFNSGQITVK